MDAKDLAILRLLDENPKQSYAQIARKARISKETAQYRIKNLEKRGILTGFFTIIAGSKLGITYHKILIKYKDLNTEKEKELLSSLEKNPSVVWYGVSDGYWNITITTASKTLQDFKDFADSIIGRYGAHIKEREIITITNITMYNEKYIYKDKEHIKSIPHDLTQQTKPIDETDKKILNMLSDNAKKPYTEIAKETNLTGEAIRQRIKSMERKKIILGYKPRISFEKLNLSYYHAYISLESPEHKKKMISYYANHPNCLATGEHIGRYDVHLELYFENTQQLRRTLEETRNQFGKIINEITSLNIYKEFIQGTLKK